MHRDHLPDIFQRPDGPVRQRDYYRELITDENVGLFVAEVGKNIVGFVHAIVRDAPAIPVFVHRRYAVVDSIAVKSGFRNRGIGQKLMSTVHEWVMAKGATSIELNVYEFNKTAIAFYYRLGYETLSRRMSKRLKV